MSQTDEEETSEIESFILDQESFGSDHSALASKLALLAATGQASLGDGSSDDQISVDAETQVRLEALLEAAGIGKLSTSDGKAFADPEVLKRLSSSVSCALDEAAAALSKMKTENENATEHSQERTLVEACSEGDVSTVKKLLCEGRSANETTEDGESLLSLACSAGYYELAEVLLSVPPYTDESTYLTSENSVQLRHKINSAFLATLNQQLTKVLLAMHANVEDCGAKGDCTPLMEAASGGYSDIVKLLLSHGADVNATSTTGNTALTYACCGGYEDVVKLLVDAGAELECHNENGHTPLMEAASGGHVRVANILLQRGAGINTHSNEFKESALTLACYKGHLQMVRFLLQAGADQEHKTDEMHTALMEASMDGHVEVARLLLDSGAQVNMPADSFESPLTLAACGGHVDLAELLIERGAALEEVNDEGYTPLMEAAREGHEEMVALLLAKSANVNAKTEETQETALTLACCGGFLECAELLVRAGGNIETGCSTPLMEAAQEGQLDLVKFLIQQGANVNATTSSGDTALSYACEHGHTDVADVLLAAGADLEHETEGGRTPLMKAARAGHLCTVQFLISRGADVNRTTKNNEHSVLSLACVCGHVSVVELLLCQGADPTLKLKDGSTMLLESSKGGHTSIVQLLLDFPHNFMSLPPETSQVASPTPEQITPRVPTESLPMVVAPQEPDQAPQIPFTISDVVDGNEEATTALVGHLIRERRLLSQASEELLPDTELAVDKDVAFTVEKFLQSMASDAAAGKARTAESIVEEAQGKLTELEQRIKEAIEKNAQLKNIEMMQTDQLTKEKVEELYKTREEQIHKKQKILEELQKVERELQLKTQQQLKQHYLDMKQAEANTPQRGKPDGEDNESIQSLENVPMLSPPEIPKSPKEAKVYPHLSQNQPPQVQVSDPALLAQNAQKYAQPLQKLNNGSSGSLPQAVKESDESYCQCVHHPCAQLSHPAQTEAEQQLEMQQGYPAPGFNQPASMVPYPHLDIDGFTESNHDTPLTLACAGGHEDLVQLLISRGANIEHRDKKGFTPLILAATAGHVGVVSILLEASADIEAQSERTKDTPLSLACSGGRLEVVELLLDRGANKEHRNVSDYTPLSLAASGGYVNIIKLLLNHGAEINSRTGSKLGISPLMLAAMNGHTQAVQLLLDMGADINAQIETNRNTALTLACFQGRHEVVSLLVDRKANVEHRAKTGLTPLMEAASGGYAEVGRVLLDKGADPNAPPVPSSRDTALTIAADKGHYRFCELVLTRGALVEVKNKKGNTPLWLACNGGHLDVVMLLVGKGADVNAADNRNLIPLMAAFRKGHVQVVKWLAKEVSQFPSDAECMRYIATITDRELLKRSHTCMECIAQAKDRQAQEANEVAKKLLEELESEKSQEQNRKERQARKREKRRKKRKQKTGKKSDGDQDNMDGDDDELDDKVDDIKELIESTDQLKITSGKVPIVSTTYTAASVAPQVSQIITTVIPSQPTVPIVQEVLSTQSSDKLKTTLPVSPAPHSGEQKKRDEKKRVHQAAKDSPVSSSGSDSSPVLQTHSEARGSSRKTRKSPTSQRPPLAVTTARPSSEPVVSKASSRGPPSGHRSATATPSPGKRPPRRDEGWKEVPTRKFASNAARRIMVNSNLISRVIGRGGSNINAIREVTGAHIDIDKQRKGGQERTVTIKGAAEAIKHAYQLITALIKEDRTDQEITSIISKVQAQAAQNAAAKQQPAPKPPMTVVAAPIPTKPAWTVPPSIVAQASSQPRVPAASTTKSTSKPSAWATNTSTTTSVATPATSAVVPAATIITSASNKWPLSPYTSTTPMTSSIPTVETVKKALFVTTQSTPPISSAPSTATPAVSFTPKSTDKPIQPVAPMVSTKVTSAPRLPASSFGPVGSGIPPSLPQVHPRMTQPSMAQQPTQQPLEIVPPESAQVEHGAMINSPQGPLSPNQAPLTSPVMVTPASSQTAHIRAVVTPGQAANHSSVTPRTPGHSGASYVNHVPSVQGEMSSAFGSISSSSGPMTTPSYSPFSNSFTPSAGSTALWNNDSNSASPYQAPVVNGMPDEPIRSHVDQSKAPGYRGSMKSPIVENGVLGGAAVSAAVSGVKSMENNPSPVGSQQGSPSNMANSNNNSDGGEMPNKPRPIGTERAHNRRANPALPLTTVVGQPATNIWSYDKLPPAQIGVDPFEQQNKYSNWSTVIPSVPLKDGTVTTSTANKPQVTTSEIDSLKPNSMDQSNNPQISTMIGRAYSSVPAMGMGQQPNRLPPSNNSQFTQPSSMGRVGTQPPIGSHLGASNSVGIVGPQQQQQQQLPPIGSHLGGAGHMRNNGAFQPQHMQQQQQRSFPGSNPGSLQQQQQARYHMPYYMQQQQQQQQQQQAPPQQHNDVSRYVQNEVSWHQQQQTQQQQQQQQQSLYQRHPQQQINPYQQKDLHNNTGVYGSLPSHQQQQQQQQQQQHYSTHGAGGDNPHLTAHLHQGGYQAPHMHDMGGYLGMHPETQGGYDSMPPYMDDYMMRGGMGGSYGGNPQTQSGSTASWDPPGVCQPGYQSMNGRSMIGSQNGIDDNPQFSGLEGVVKPNKFMRL